jgi:hypothetical protein
MKLTVGQRLTASGPIHQPGGYVVTGVVRETPWHGLYAGKKIFYNFDFTGKRPRETDDKEWLDVFLRTIEYPVRDDAVYVAARRAQARSEARRILGSRSSNLWPEPVDLLEIANTRDPFTFAAQRRAGPPDLEEPVVVFAHPHGQTLAEWQQQVLPLASLLAVLAETLSFMEQAHGAGLVLNGLSPQSVLVDRAERVHYVGTDMVFVVSDAPAAPAWQRFYPAQRYVAGFAPAECFEHKIQPDFRTDLYSWGSLAYFLLTGESPGRIAQEQGRSWAHFQEVHFANLERALRSVPPAHLRNWAEQLGLNPEGFTESWPGNILAVFRLLLHPDPRRRPRKIAELRAWLTAPPPPSVAAALALYASAERVRVLVDPTGLLPDLDMVIRRGMPPGPAEAMEGEPVYDGPLTEEVDDLLSLPNKPAVHAVFTRQRRSGLVLFSVPVQAEAIGPSPADVLRLLEQFVSGDDLDQPEPAILRLVVRGLGELRTMETMLTSALNAVRAWAVRRLVAGRHRPEGAAAEHLLWQTLKDSVPTLQLEAARVLLGDPAQPDLELVRRVAVALGGDDVDERIQAAYSLSHIGLNEEALRRTVEAFEGDRPAACPVCYAELTGRDRPAHLREVHGFVDVFGALLPRQAALERLWDRILLQGDVQAHHRLLEVLKIPERNGDAGRVYVSVLEEELQRRSDPPAALSERLVSCWRRDARVERLVPDLLRSGDERVRDLCRTFVLGELAAELVGDKGGAADLRRRLDQLCPEDLIEEKIILCLRLPSLGVDMSAANACLAQLQEERPILCSECRARVRLSDLETHLRHAHGIFEFRGVRRSFGELRAFLVATVCGPSPDYAAWNTLETIARERYGEGANERVTSWLGQGLRALDRSLRPQGVKALAEAIVAGGSGNRWLPLLAGPSPVAATRGLRRTLALEVAGRMSPPLDQAWLATLHPLLSDRQIPRESRQAAVAALLHTTGNSGPMAEVTLAAYVAGNGKIRAIDRLHLLEQYVGKAPAIEAVCAKLEDQVRMNCPRCPTQLRRAQMVQHLWDRHRLMLEGRRVREPWRMIEDWLEDYRLERDAAVLDRCRDLAVKLDPEHGVRQVQRLLLRHGVEDREALVALLEQARRAHTCLCPHCYNQIPVHEPVAQSPLTFRNDSLEGEDYYIEVSENGLWPRVQIEGPEGTIHDGREPGTFLTRNGALAFVVAPLVVACLVVPELFPGRRLPLALEALLATGVGLFVGALIYLVWPAGVKIRDRLIDCAWTLLIAEREQNELSAADAAFIASLARSSAGWGNPARRAGTLEDVCKQMEKLARRDQASVPHLAAVWRLRVDDLIQQEEDPLGPLAEQVGRCFAARLPLDYAAELLKGLTLESFPAEAHWARNLMRRLPILLCEQAFTAGMEVSDLIDVAQAYPEMHEALGLERVDHVAHLRLLWSLRADRPWEKCGAAVTAFDLAGARFGGKVLARFPDLVLSSQGIDLYVCGRGICFEDVWFNDMSTTVEMRENRARGGYELIVGPHHFSYDVNPEGVAARLEKWFHYYFRDFAPQLAAVRTRRAPDVVQKLQARNGVACPECKKKVLIRAGAVGVTLDERVMASWV